MHDKSISFVKHVLVYGAGAVSLQVAGVVLIPLYTHYLQPEEYGILQLIYRIGGVFQICLMIPGIRLATFNLVGHAEDPRQYRRTAASVALVTLVSLAAGWLIIFAVHRQLGALLGIGDSRLLVCGVATIILQALTTMPLTMMQARFESTYYVCVSVGIALCHITLAVITVAGLGWGVWGVIGGLALTHAGFSIVLTFRELLRESFLPDLAQVRRLVWFSVPLIPAGLLMIVMDSSDQFFLMKLHGAAAVGVYALAYRIVQAATIFSTEPLCQVWQPWIYRAFKRHDGPAQIGRAATRILAVYTFAGMGVVLLRHEGIGLLCSGAYAAAATVIPPLALAFFFLLASNLLDASFYVASQTSKRVPVAVISTVTLLTGHALLIPAYGGLGAAYSLLIGCAVKTVVNWIMAQRVYRVHYELGRVAAMLALALLAVAGSWWLDHGIPQTALKCVLWMSWPACLWVTGLVTPEEKRYVLAGLVQVVNRLRNSVWASRKGSGLPAVEFPEKG